MGTPHNQANPGDIAKTVLMPGDPLRAKFIAETFLTDVKKVNEVRNMFAYTGKYQGHEITVMASGMGMPSIGIYSYELYSQYNVENIIRIGSAGSYTEELKLFDVVLADKVWSQSSFGMQQNGDSSQIKYPDGVLNQAITEAGKRLEIPVKTDCVHSSDVFYSESNVDKYETIHEKHGCGCVEMESFALFHNAQVLKKRAACLLTISDSFVTHEVTTAQQRQEAFTNMMKVALEAAIAMEDK